MRRTHLLGALGACALGALVIQPAAAITIDYSSIPLSYVEFDPDNNCTVGATVGCFSFNPSPNIEIDSGTAAGDQGTIAGTFEVGTD